MPHVESMLYLKKT